MLESDGSELGGVMKKPSKPSEYSLAWENYVVAQVATAAIGLISRDIVGLAAEIGWDSVVLHAALARMTDEVRDDLDEICDELDNFLEGHVVISHVEYIGAERPWPPRRSSWVPIYVAKWEDDDNDGLSDQVQHGTDQ